MIIEIWKYISVALACTVSLSKIGIPTAIAVFGFNYFNAVFTSCVGAIFGTIVFTYLSAGLLKWWDKLKDKWFASKHPKKIFTKSNRRVIRIKHRFGLIGIAALTPILLSIPIGAFLAERFYKDKKKVIIYLSVAAIFWCNALYFIFLLFYSTYKSIA